MNLTTPAYYAVATLAALAVGPALVVLARESWRRSAAKREVERMQAARAAIDEVAQSTPEAAVRALQRRFDTTTLDRALEATLRADASRVAWVAETYKRAGLTERAIRDVRGARAWSERARAAEVLGLLGVAEAVPALVEALRDPYEDTLSVKVVVAEALARIRDPAVIPLLVKELRVIDEWSSPRVAEALVRFRSTATPFLVELLREDERSGAAVWAARVLGRIGDQTAVPTLMERLRDRQDAMRTAAAEALGAIGDRRAIRALIQATLRDPIAQVRAHAAAALGRLKDEDSADVLIAALGDPDYGTRIRSLEALEMIRPRNIAPMESALRDPRPDVRRRAAQAIERVGYLDARLRELTSEDREVAARAYAAVMELGRAGLVDSLAGHLSDGDFRVRAYLAQACGELGATRVAPLLISALDDTAWPVRARLAEAIGRTRAPEGAAALTKLLNDPEVVVREAAAAALVTFSAEETSPHDAALRVAMERGSLTVRVALVEVLSRHERPGGVEVLLRAARESSERVRVRAVAGLSRVTSPEVDEVLARALTDSAVSVRLAAVDALGARESSLEALLRALSGAAPEVRERIAKVLAQPVRGGPELQRRLATLAASDDRDVRLGVSWTLGKIGAPEGVPALSTLLRDPDAALRASAAGALGKIRVTSSLDALLEASDDNDPRARAAVVNAIARLGFRGPEVLSALRGRLMDPDGFVRNRALLALGRVGGSGADDALAQVADDERFDPAARAVGLALVGNEASLAYAVRAIAVPSLLRRVRALLTDEDDDVRRAFYARLELEDRDRGVEATLDAEAIIAQYHELLKGSRDAAARRVAVEALAAFRSERSLETLGDALASDPAEDVRLRAAEAVAQKADREVARRALLRAVNDPSESVARVVVRALGRSRDLRCAEAVFQRLGGSSLAVEREAIDALAELYRDAPASFVDRMMGARRVEVTAACLGVLEQMAAPSLLPLLKHLLRASAAEVRAGAVRALAALPSREANVAVDEARRDPHEAVRIASMDAIARRASASAVDRLAALRADPSVDVRRALASALAAFTDPLAERLVDELLQDLSPIVRAAALGTLLQRDTPESLRRFSGEWARCGVEAQQSLRDDPRAAALATRARNRLSTERDAALREIAVDVIATLAATGYEDDLLDALRDNAATVRVAAIERLSQVASVGVREAIEALTVDPDAGVRTAAWRALDRDVA